MSNQNESRELTPVQEIRQTFKRMGGELRSLLPTDDHVDRFVRVIMTAIQDKPELWKCNRASLYSAALKCAKDGLLPDGKEAHINVRSVKIERNPDKWADMAQYEPMVEGLLKLFRNSGQCLGVPNVQVVREKDVFRYVLGDSPRIEHEASLGDRGKIVAAYSIVTLIDGAVTREVMGIDEILEVREISKAKDSGPWKLGPDGKHTTQFGEQCRKTVFRRHYKKLPRATDLDNVLKSDNEQYDLDRTTSAHDPVDVSEPETAPAAFTAPNGRKRPKALTKVAAAGGEPVPEQTPQQREPEPIEGQATREPAEQQQGATHPTDVI